MPDSRGPYVNYALFCEKVLAEPDNVLSFIRVVDRPRQRGRGTGPPAVAARTTMAPSRSAHSR